MNMKFVIIDFKVVFNDSLKLWEFESFIEEYFRRKGIGTQMYNYAMGISERTIYPHHENPYSADNEDVSEDALNFWKKRKY